MNTNLPVKQEKKGFFAKLGGFFRKVFGIKEKSYDDSKFASVAFDDTPTNGINFGNGYKYDQMMNVENKQENVSTAQPITSQPQAPKFNMSDTQKLVYENSTAFVPEKYMYMNNVTNDISEQQPLAIASDIDKKEIVVPTDMKTEPVVEDQNAIVHLNDEIPNEEINMGILDYSTERALDELDEYFADEEVANDYVEEEQVPVIQEYTFAEKFDKLIENVDLTYDLEPELKEVFDDPEKQDQIKEIIEIVESNPESLDNLDEEGLKLIDAYYKRDIALIGAQIKALNV